MFHRNRIFPQTFCKCHDIFSKGRKHELSKESKRKGWKSVVGLEVHAQMKTQSKLFSGSSTVFGCPVNTNVSLLDAAIPGTLPVLNKKCVEMGVLTALAFSCRMNSISMFDRKHYFYADLPAGYQITQQRAPLAQDGLINFTVYQPGVHKAAYPKTSKIIQLQLEQDSGKSLHDEELQRSLIDLNRAGIPLMEIVFAPDLSDGEEAAALVKELILILMRLGTCSCKMEEGALRVDANISINREGQPYGIRTEVKNIGSVRGVANAVDYEIERQLKVILAGGEIVNETRTWDAPTGTTLPMRDKEVKQDYRFMPEPNLPPLKLNMTNESRLGSINVNDLKALIPELPEQTRENLKVTYKLSQEMILQLVNEEHLLALFLEIMKVNKRNAKQVACILTIEYMTLVNKKMSFFNDNKFDAFVLGEIADLLQSEYINLLVVKKLFEEIALGNSKKPTEIVNELCLKQIKDTEELKRICSSVIERNPKIVAKYRSGKTKVLPALLGIVARETNNRAKMDVVVVLMKDMLQYQ